MNCDFTLYDLIARNADLYPGKEMMVYEGNRIHFKTYKKLCDQYAAGLSSQGVAAGDRIAVLSGNCDDFMLLLGAAAKIGAVLVPLNWRLSEDEIAYILNDCNPTVLVSGREYLDMARKAAPQAASIKKCFAFKTDDRDGEFIPFRALCLDEASEQAFPVSAHSPCMIIYTAAVGGKPRGCLLSQANLAAAGLQLVHLLELSSRDCHVCTLPLFHIGGLAMTLATMHQGGKTAFIDRFDPLLVLDLIEKERGSFFGAFPPMLSSILEAQEKRSFDVSS
ncbi:MAG: AMP-dependent synthetase, partial [Syntrophus sp. (in: bacteria)]|nr:AMP-dependent synthetase [Syntrophus sp. (in: bacteria)]